MRLYHSRGQSYLVCPRLLEIDPRHGDHPSKWPPCRSGASCPRPHKHEKLIADGGGHAINVFIWVPGARPPSPDEHPVCDCGAALVWADLLDLYGAEHLSPEVTPDGA